MACLGNSDDHCCWVNGALCPHLEENTVAGRRWACGLLRELGSWKAVHRDRRYVKDVQPMWNKFPTNKARGLAMRCGDFPASGERCNACGVVG